MAQYCYYNNNTSNPIHRINLNGNTYRKMNVNGTPYTISTWYSGTCTNGVYTVSTYSTRYEAKSNETYYRYNITNSQRGPDTNYYTYSTSFSYSTVYKNWTPMAYNSSSSTFKTGLYSVSSTIWLSTPAVTVTFPPYITTYLYSTKGYNNLAFSYSASGIAASQFAASNFSSFYNIFNHPKHGVTNYPTSTISCYLQGYLQWNYIFTNSF